MAWQPFSVPSEQPRAEEGAGIHPGCPPRDAEKTQELWEPPRWVSSTECWKVLVSCPGLLAKGHDIAGGSAQCLLCWRPTLCSGLFHLCVPPGMDRKYLLPVHLGRAVTSQWEVKCGGSASPSPGCVGYWGPRQALAQSPRWSCQERCSTGGAPCAQQDCGLEQRLSEAGLPLAASHQGCAPVARGEGDQTSANVATERQIPRNLPVWGGGLATCSSGTFFHPADRGRPSELGCLPRARPCTPDSVQD